MAQKQTIIIPAPLKGQSDAWARQEQPPRTTANCDNVEPRDREDRMVIASRPGLSKAFNSYQFGS